MQRKPLVSVVAGWHHLKSHLRPAIRVKVTYTRLAYTPDQRRWGVRCDLDRRCGDRARRVWKNMEFALKYIHDSVYSS